MDSIVLMINFRDKDREEKISDIIRRKGIDVRRVDRAMYDQKVAAMCGLDEFFDETAIYEGPEFDREMMIFAQLKEGKLDEILAEMKNRGIAKVDLKAIATPYNITWTIRQLYSELTKEHKAVQEQINKMNFS